MANNTGIKYGGRQKGTANKATARLREAAPLSPMICSVDRFVKSKEPAITTPVKLLPPKK